MFYECRNGCAGSLAKEYTDTLITKTSIGSLLVTSLTPPVNETRRDVVFEDALIRARRHNTRRGCSRLYYVGTYYYNIIMVIVYSRYRRPTTAGRVTHNLPCINAVITGLAVVGIAELGARWPVSDAAFLGGRLVRNYMRAHVGWRDDLTHIRQRARL